MIWFIFVVGALAVFRLTELVISDKITEPLREKVYNRFGQPHESQVSYLFTCPWCVSIYFGFPTAFVLGWDTLSVPLIIALALSYSAVTGLLSQAKDRI